MSKHDKFYKDLQELEATGMPTRVASDVLYLRNQEVWSQPLEDKFIADAATGEVPDITQVGKS